MSKISDLASSITALLLPLSLGAAEHHHGGQLGVQSLDVFSDGSRVHLLTGELREAGAKSVLVYRFSEGGGTTWSKPVRVEEGQPSPHSLHRGMDAQIAASGDFAIAAWTTAGTDQWGSGPVATALSSDGGKTWGAGPNPADDGTTTGHGFIDLAIDSGGTVHLTWLDSRDGKQGLRYARSSDHGRTWSQNVTLKAATCECCTNTIATEADGQLAILFRDGNPRDMGISVSRDSGRTWAAPSSIIDFGWQFNGCPHVGGGLAITPGEPGRMHALVWTGMTEHAGIYHVTSGDLGTRWSKPHRLGDPTSSHPDIATAADGRVAAAWDQSANDGTHIFAAISWDGGSSWEGATRLSGLTVIASHPRIVATTKGFHVFWTGTSSNKAVEFGSATIP